MVTNREQQILALLREDPMVSQHAIAAKLGISRSSVAGHIMHLTDKGLIKGRGYVLSDAPFVAIVGGANIDIHGKSLQPLRDRDSNPGTVNTSAGGVARNVAENLARLGVDCRLISAIGADHNGEMLTRLSRDAGVDMRHVHEIAGAPTSTYVAVLDASGDMQLAISDMSIIDHLSAERLKSQQGMLHQSSLIVLDTNLRDDAIAWLTGTFVATPIFADTVSTTKAPRLAPYLAAIHTLKTSAIEVETLTGMEARALPQLRKVVRHLHSQGVARVFVTRGDQGVFYSTGDTAGSKKFRRVQGDVLNAGGAGDAFLAGLAYAWLDDMTLDASLEFALAAADITLSHSRTSSPALSLTAINRVLETPRAS